MSQRQNSNSGHGREGQEIFPRILILSSSVGAGHLRAAEAIELALRDIEPGATVRNLDVLQLTNATFRRLYGQAYLDLVSKAPHVLGYFYDLLDRQKGPKQKSDRLRILVERLNLRPFLRLLQEGSWDVVVNTHFLSAEIIGSLRRNGKLSTPHMTVTTDYETHRLWVAQPCEHYCTATEEGANYLEHWGVPKEDISVTGIPIHPAFSQCQSRPAPLKSQDRPIVLQLAGGFGVGPIEKIYRGLLEIKIPLEIVVVAGRNEEAKEKLEKIGTSSYHLTKVIGFTDKIHELMAVADLVVSKPGGLTTSEVLASGAAMAIVNPIPGQESRNSDFLLENGAAIKINNIATLPYKLTKLFQNKRQLARLKKNASKLGKPGAAFDVSRIALKIARASRS